MACETWSAKLDLYLDGELAPAEATALAAHMRSCVACAADAVERVQMKRAVAAAGRRYKPSAQLRAAVMKQIGARPQPRLTGSPWRILFVPAMVVLIISVAMIVYVRREGTRQQRAFSELADLHVAALASANPVDVVSTDRHTVKPWFQGKIPFTFNLPDLQGSDFTLLGGRVTYFAQSPGAHLIYQIRKHEISVFILQDSAADATGLPQGAAHPLSFNSESWAQDGLRYLLIGDVSANDIHELSRLLRDAR